jgi:bifunctional DNA-binding transcriptional regulator/antitoxin component of YhaV-PrlF toxin-antitoxin module
MRTRKKFATTLSNNGEVSLPAEILRRQRWKSDTRLTIEDTPQGVLLTAAPLFPPTRPEDVFGSLASAGPPKALEDMQGGIRHKAKTKRR